MKELRPPFPLSSSSQSGVPLKSLIKLLLLLLLLFLRRSKVGMRVLVLTFLYQFYKGMGGVRASTLD
jgi:hypothetical protein